MKVETRFHPPSLFAYRPNFIYLIIKVANDKRGYRWYEADISVDEKLSLAPDYHLKKGRIRIGILRRNESIEKSVKVYADTYTPPQLYNIKIVVYAFDKNGVIAERKDLKTEVKVEIKKKEVIE